MRRLKLLVIAGSAIALSIANCCNGQEMDETGLWRLPQRCGVNCAYLFIRSHGADVEYAELCNELLSGPYDDTSLAEIESACKSRGVWCEPSKIGPTELVDGEFPIILHLETGSRGHFILVLDAGEDHITFIDGTSGKAEMMSSRELSRQWSGYVLAPARYSYFNRQNFTLFMIALTVSIVVWISLSTILERSRRWRLNRHAEHAPQLHSSSH